MLGGPCAVPLVVLFSVVGLRKEAVRLMESALTAPSAKIYDRCVGRYVEFCEDIDVVAFPAGAASVELWVAHLSKEGFAHGTVLGHLSALKHHSKCQGWKADFQSDRLDLMLRGLKKGPQGKASTRRPVTLSHLRRLSKAAAVLGEREAVRFVAMGLLAFFGFLRPSEYCVSGSGHHMRRSGVKVSKDGRQCRLTLESHKHSDGPAVVLIRDDECGPLRPVASLRRYLELYHVAAGGPLFGLSQKEFRGSLEEVRRAAGVKSHITPHSFRHGGATWAAAAGWPDARIRAHGRWHSDAYKAYVKSS